MSNYKKKNKVVLKIWVALHFPAFLRCLLDLRNDLSAIYFKIWRPSIKAQYSGAT